MKKSNLLPYLAISVIALVSRFPLIEKVQSHWDGPDYSIAIIRYSLEQHTPTPPGYPLYIALGKIFHFFVNDPHLSILLVSILASCIGAFAFYTFGKNIYNKYIAYAATAIFLTGSPFYFFSLTPYGYLLIASLVVWLALIVYRVFILKKQHGLLFGFILGLCFGVRPQEMIMVGPLAFLGFIFLNKQNKIIAAIMFSTITLFWLIPLIYDSGGIQNYFRLNLASPLSPGFTHSFLYNLPLAAKGFLLSFGISAVFLVYIPYAYLSKKIKFNKKIFIFFSVWIMPGLFFNLFIRGEHAGYQISYLCAILILIAYSMWAVTKKKVYLFYICLTAVSVFNLFWFFYDRDPNFTKPFRPTSFHYSDIRKNDIKTGSKVNYIINNFNPNNTLLVASDVLWRPYSYYLKDFKIIALYALDTKHPPHNYNRYEGYQWNMKHLIQKDFTIKIPSKVNKVIMMDDKGYDWVQDKNKQKVNLPANTILTIIDVSQNNIVNYDYHKIFVKR